MQWRCERRRFGVGRFGRRKGKRRGLLNGRIFRCAEEEAATRSMRCIPAGLFEHHQWGSHRVQLETHRMGAQSTVWNVAQGAQGTSTAGQG